MWREAGESLFSQKAETEDHKHSGDEANIGLSARGMINETQN